MWTLVIILITAVASHSPDDRPDFQGFATIQTNIETVSGFATETACQAAAKAVSGQVNPTENMSENLYEGASKTSVAAIDIIVRASCVDTSKAK